MKCFIHLQDLRSRERFFCLLFGAITNSGDIERLSCCYYDYVINTISLGSWVWSVHCATFDAKARLTIYLCMIKINDNFRAILQASSESHSSSYVHAFPGTNTTLVYPIFESKSIDAAYCPKRLSKQLKNTMPILHFMSQLTLPGFAIYYYLEWKRCLLFRYVFC